MVDKTKVINFLQDFGCAKLEHLQILFNDEKNNFKSITDGNVISRKKDIFVHNTRKINERMLVALDILCKFKSRLSKFYLGYDPIFITFLTKDNLVYHIIVANEENAKGIVKIINAYPLSLPKADRLILAFPNSSQLENIECEASFIYVTYPGCNIINKYDKNIISTLE